MRASRRALRDACYGCLLGCAVYLLWLPDVDRLRRSNPRTTAFIERYVQTARARGKRPRILMRWTPFEEISPDLRHAVIIAEDDMFYRHEGVDWESMRQAADYDWKKGRFERGASTITQQVARNLFLTPSKNPLRKAKELLIAWRLERALGKRRILELYLNIAEWGDGIYGAEAASETYFGKAASAVTPEEAVALAAALPSPRRLNPSRKAGPKMLKRREVLLERMRKAGYLPAQTPLSAPATAQAEILTPKTVEEEYGPDEEGSADPAPSESP